MKCTLPISLFSAMILVLVLASANAGPSECTPKSGSCDTYQGQNCCSRYCRNGECINFGDSPDDSGVSENPCRRRCPRGEVCVLQQVQCIRAPCPPIRSCVARTERA